MNRKKFSLLAHFEIYIFLFILFSIFFPGCGGGGGNSNSPQTAPSQQFTTDPNTGALKLVFEIPQKQNGNRLTTIDCSSVDTSRCRNRNNIENTRLTSKIPANTAKVWAIVFRGNIFAERSAANAEGSLDPNETNFSPQRRREHREKTVEGSLEPNTSASKEASTIPNTENRINTVNALHTPHSAVHNRKLPNRQLSSIISSFQTAGYTIDATSSAAPKDGRVTLFLNNILPGFKTVGIWTEDSSGNITAESFEFVEIEADKISSMDTTLGLVMDSAGKFYTNSLNIAPGETLVIKTMRDGSTTFTPTSGSNCPTITLKKYGILNCTIISPATGTVTYNTGITGSTLSINISGTLPSKLFAADPSADTTFGIAPLAVKFTGGATALGETVSSYAWNFGDGAATSTEPSPSHTYTREGTYNVSFKVTAASGSSNTSSVRIVVLKNNAPVITSTPVTTATPNTAYTYDVNATDADGDILTYSLTTNPTGMTINSSTGLISWTPTAEGVSSISVAAADGKATTTQNFAITVSATPVTPPPSSGSGGNSYFPLAVGNKWYYRYDEWFEGESHSWFEELDKVEIVRTETSSGKTVYVVSGTPEGSPTERKMYFENSNYYQDGSIILKQPASVGQTWTGTFKHQVLSTTETVSAGGNTYTGCVKIKVGDYNHYEYYKPGIGLVKVERINVPLGSTSSGQYINVLVELVSYTIVGQTNSPPTANAGADQTVTAGTQVTLDGSGSSDADGDTLTYSWTQISGPVTLQLSNSSTSKPIFTPTATGSYIFSLVVNDGKTNGLADTVTITVSSPNRTPTITSTAVATATVGTAYTYDVNATDADSDTLTYSLTTNPTGMTINSTTGLISWTPSATGSHDIVASVSDGKGGVATQGWTITVSAPFNGNIQRTKITAGTSHTCVLFSNGTIKCWGLNSSGQLGTGNTTTSSTPVSVSGISNAVSITAGTAHTCALFSNGTIKCWGYNGSGQLGTGNTTSSSTPVSVNGITNAIAISSGEEYTCAALSDGTVKCWGYNGSGRLGNGTTTSSSTPVTVSGITTAITVSAGEGHTCAVLSNGTIKCWGYNSCGQLGNGTGSSSTTPTTVTGITNAIAAAAGSEWHSCAIMSDGIAKCWGGNSEGAVGDGTNSDRYTPVTVTNISGVASIETSGSGWYVAHTCALTSDGAVKCWGENNYGQFGNGTTARSNVPVATTNISNATAMSTNIRHTCALLSDDTVKCWGYNAYGQLGNGATTNSSVPVIVLLNPNNNPTITSTAIATATVNIAYTYDVNATDADGDTLTYSLTCSTCPTIPTINSTTGLISWTPSAAGSNNVTVSVSDGKGGTATQSWTVTVTLGGGGSSDNPWITISAGDFIMGCASGDSSCYSGESPKHTVTLSTYKIQKYEVTNAQYKQCVDAGRCTAPQESSSDTRSTYYGNTTYNNYPVIYVDWNQAKTYCEWLGGRLPTEAEWEKAARGPSSREVIYPWGNGNPTCSLGNFYVNGDCVGDTSTVGNYPSGASYYDVMDMAGNVWEWVNDWYGETYYSSSPSSNPQGPAFGDFRALRGGSWSLFTRYIRVSNRGWYYPTSGNGVIGFRCAQN